MLTQRPAIASEIKSSYLYNLSDSSGSIPYNWVNLSCDAQNDEVYVVNVSDGTVSIFNGYGMQVYSFEADEGIGSMYDVAVEENGDLLLLSYLKGKYEVTRCNFRGEPKSRIEFKDLPKELAKEFSPNDIVCRKGRIYLIDKGSMKVMVAGKDGVFVKYYDLAAILKLDEKKRLENGIVGFSIDCEGNMLFTIPSMFSAFVVSPESKVNAFGVRGSSPGKFNIVGGITSDDKGNYYVVDTLRAVVMVFDKDFKFLSEFGNWGFDPGNLVAPMEVIVSKEKVYVTQSRGRGVSVYHVNSD